MTSQLLAITGGRVWTAIDPQPLEGATVLVEDGRIAAVGTDVEIPDAAEQVDATGRFVMPGLVDMHVHVMLCGEDSLYGFLATGVTSVRDLGGDLAVMLPTRDAIARGERTGPRIFTYGPMLDGTPPIFPQTSAGAIGGLTTVLPDVEAARAEVESLIEAGVDGLKLYAGQRPELMGPIIEAVAGRVPVAGHLGRTWASEAIALGIDSIEHVHASCYQDVVAPEDRHTRDGGNGVIPNYWTWLSEGWARADLDAPHVQQFIEQVAASGMAISPTTVLITGGMATTEASEEPGQRYRTRFMTERARQRQQQMVAIRAEEEAAGRSIVAMESVDPKVGGAARANELELLRRIHDAGGVIVPSTDVRAAPLQVPGFSLHRELALLVEAGIPAEAVLRAATAGAARVLRRDDDFGTIEVGKRADLLIIDGDPLARIEDSRNVEWVIAGGVVHEPQALLDQIETDSGE
jgi:imidazolonepropionase-like amidohydrolase